MNFNSDIKIERGGNQEEMSIYCKGPPGPEIRNAFCSLYTFYLSLPFILLTTLYLVKGDTTKTQSQAKVRPESAQGESRRGTPSGGSIKSRELI